MGLIKHAHAVRLTSRGFEDLGDLKQQAEHVVAAARAEAQRILDGARAEAEAKLREAEPRGHAEGFAHGLAEGREEGRRAAHEEAIGQFKAEIEQLIAAWREALARIEAERSDMMLAARSDILEFAIAMGRKITHRIIEADPAVVADQIVAALRLVAAPTAVTVSIHPDDRRLVESVLGAIVEQFKDCTHVELRDDPGVGRCGCIVATARGRIDASIEQQVERITTTLLAGASVRPEQTAVRTDAPASAPVRKPRRARPRSD